MTTAAPDDRRRLRRPKQRYSYSRKAQAPPALAFVQKQQRALRTV
jgi:hypothetical protein